MAEESRLARVEAHVEKINTSLLTAKIYAKVISFVAVAFGITAAGVISYLLVQVGEIDSKVGKAKDSAIKEVRAVEDQALVAVRERADAFRLLAVPIGTIVPYGGPVRESEVDKPEEKLALRQFAEDLEKRGWMVCDGRPLLREEFGELYDALGQAHGTGFDQQDKRVGDFNLPDYRGRFLRGVDHDVGRDPDSESRVAASNGGNPGDRVGSCQADATELPGDLRTRETPDHTHDACTSHAKDGPLQAEFQLAWGAGDWQKWGIRENDPRKGEQNGGIRPSGQHAHEVLGTSADETRPANAYVNWLIRAR